MGRSHRACSPTISPHGMAVFRPKFLMRIRGLTESMTTVGSGLVLVATGLVGTTVGGWVADRLLARTRQAYLWVSGVATLVAAPVGLVALLAPSPVVYWTAPVPPELLLFSSTGPINSAIVNLVAP